MLRFPLAATLVLGLVTAEPILAATAALDDGAADERALDNLATFARVYGYVRFFHPSDEAAALDWDKFAMVGAETVRDAADPAALRAALLHLFAPIAPTLRLTTEPAPAATPAAANTGGPLIFWQYQGLSLTNQPGPYRQRRVVTDESRGDHAPLFKPATAPPPLVRTIAPGIVLWLPLALPVGTDGKTSPTPAAALAALQAEMDTIDFKALKEPDWRVRVAAVVSVWSVFQHFHPYLDLVGVKWDDALRPALRGALDDVSIEDYWATLMELVAKTHDGHGYAYVTPPGRGGIPIRVACIEDKIVVTGVADAAPFKKGDVIARLDGVPALEVMRQRERRASGSPQLSEFRALNQFGLGRAGSVARLEIERDGQTQEIAFTRTTEKRGYFFNPIGEFELPAFAEVRPGIFYVNLNSLDEAGLEEKLTRLAEARGVIFDWRWDGRKLDEKAKRIQPHTDIIAHLIDATIQASPMLTPQISVPDRAGWTYRESTWPVEPKAPRFKGRIVFINEPSVVSYGETCMAMIADYHLATLVGAPTAGTNGNVSFIPLPGGGRVMWTAMDVRKHDRSPFYNIGFVPDYPVPRTLAAVKAGRDEYLEKAISVIESATTKM
jgi:hypothetical protein